MARTCGGEAQLARRRLGGRVVRPKPADRHLAHVGRQLGHARLDATQISNHMARANIKEAMALMSR
jgi:hypothetical protein